MLGTAIFLVRHLMFSVLLHYIHHHRVITYWCLQNKVVAIIVLNCVPFYWDPREQTALYYPSRGEWDGCGIILNKKWRVLCIWRKTTWKKCCQVYILSTGYDMPYVWHMTAWKRMLAINRYIPCLKYVFLTNFWFYSRFWRQVSDIAQGKLLGSITHPCYIMNCGIARDTVSDT